MARRSTLEELEVSVPSHLARSASWAGLRAGDRIDLVDPRERGGSWAFAAHVTNLTTGDAWVEVVGGRAGERRRRSVRPEQVFAHRSARRGAPVSSPLSDAPQLPL